MHSKIIMKAWCSKYTNYKLLITIWSCHDQVLCPASYCMGCCIWQQWHNGLVYASVITNMHYSAWRDCTCHNMPRQQGLLRPVIIRWDCCYMHFILEVNATVKRACHIPAKQPQLLSFCINLVTQPAMVHRARTLRETEIKFHVLLSMIQSCPLWSLYMHVIAG